MMKFLNIIPNLKTAKRLLPAACLLVAGAIYVLGQAADDGKAKAPVEAHEDHDHDKGEAHEGHDHDKGEAHEGHDHDKGEAHEGHDHSAEEGKEHEDHDHEEGMVELTDVQQREIGLKLGTAGAGSLLKELSIPGEVALNEDTLVHIVPKVAGIALRIQKSIGDKVRAGELLATVDSAELGDAKSGYYEIYNEVGCCLIDLQRARAIAANVGELLSDLKKGLEIKAIRDKKYGDMGQYRAALLGAYAEYRIAQWTFERKEKLLKEKVGSKTSYFEARAALEKAEAQYHTAVDDATFEIRQKLLEQERAQRVNEMKMKTAERKLRILGMPESDIKALQKAAFSPKKVCADPNCKNCVAGKDPAKDRHTHEDCFSQLPITAPMAGTIIEKHITRGEKVGDETEIFTLADLSNVWIHLQVPARDLPLVHKGMDVTVVSPDDARAMGKILIVSPTVNEESRTATVRMVIDNPDNRWRPGSFITGRIALKATDLPLVIPKYAVQNIEGEDVVFIPGDHGFKPVPVVTGRSDRKSVEIVSGLRPGMRYVAKGAFELKAVIVTSSLGGHAGHGH